jgi:hypothetical protein
MNQVGIKGGRVSSRTNRQLHGKEQPEDHGEDVINPAYRTPCSVFQKYKALITSPGHTIITGGDNDTTYMLSIKTP